MYFIYFFKLNLLNFFVFGGGNVIKLLWLLRIIKYFYCFCVLIELDIIECRIVLVFCFWDRGLSMYVIIGDIFVWVMIFFCFMGGIILLVFIFDYIFVMFKKL